KLDAAPFAVIAGFTLFYAVAPFLQISGMIKYLFIFLLLSCCLPTALTRQRFNFSPLFPVAAFLLATAGAVSFAYSNVMAPGRTTYASALIPLSVAATPILIPTGGAQTNATRIAEYLFKIFGIAAVLHVLWQMTDYLLQLDEGDPGRYFGHHEV